MNIIRYLRGERPGMGSELVMPDQFGEQMAVVSLSPTIAVAQQVLVPDVSFYQAAIDFRQMKAMGAAGVIIRAGQRTWPDSKFKDNWQQAKAAGLPRGSYWFYDSREDPKKQAALWWSLIKDDPGELVHAADFEESYGGPYGKPEHFETFLNEFRWLSKLPADRVAIYTAYYWWLERVGVALEFKQYPLWLAWYADASVVRVPGPWDAKDLLFWQYTSSGDGAKYGVSSQEIDLSWYCCSQVHFDNRFQLTTTPSLPGGEMLYGKCVATDGLNIRTGAGTSYAKIGAIAFADHVIATEDVGGWWHITHAYRGSWDGDPVKLLDGTTVEARAAASNDCYVKASYVIIVAGPPLPPEPPPVVVKVPFDLVVEGFDPYHGELTKKA